MTLGEFIQNFSHNNLVRLHYKINGWHHQCVLNSVDDVCMDWQITKGQGPYRHYINNQVIGVIGIYGISTHPDAINIVIEKLDNQPFVEEVCDIKNLGISDAI